MGGSMGLVLLAGFALAANPGGGGQTTMAPNGRSQPVLEVFQKMPEHLEIGVPFPIEITIRNNGSGTADGVVVKDQIPEGYEVVESNPPGERYKSAITWALGRIPAGEQRSMLLKLTPVQGAVITAPKNSIDVAFEGHVSNVTVGKFRSAELVLSVDAPKAAFVGQPVVIKMVLRNVGLSAAKNVSLMTTLPDGLTHPAGPDLESNITNLAPGMERVVTLEAMTMRAGDFRVRVRAQADRTPPVDQDVMVRGDDNRLTVDIKGQATMQQNLTGLFEIVVHNEGSTTSPRVSINVALSDGMTYVLASDAGSYDSRNHSVHWELGDLKPGETRAVSWNGIARKAGNLESKILLSSDQRPFRDKTWTLRVTPASKPAGQNVVED